MAKSTCVKCGKLSFENVEIKPEGSNKKMIAVQCVGCGGVVGIIPHYNTSDLIFDQNKAINAIATKVGISVNLKT